MLPALFLTIKTPLNYNKRIHIIQHILTQKICETGKENQTKRDDFTVKMNLMGKLDIRISQLCFGTLPMGPLQAGIPMNEGVALLRKAFENGVNFYDTAELYGTYSYLKEAFAKENDVVIATKSTAETYADMEKSIFDALEGLGRETIDIFHLHAARAKREVFIEREGALQCLVDYRDKGLIRTVGISTHAVDVVEEAATYEDIDIVFPIVNLDGLGILRGNLQDMLKAVQTVHQAGKGLYAMKALGGGHYLERLLDAIEFTRNLREMDAVSVGMVRKEELDVHLHLFNDRSVPQGLIEKCLAREKKKVVVLGYCRQCYRCVETCPSGAIHMGEKKPEVDQETCLRCGYCLPGCPEFNLRFA